MTNKAQISKEEIAAALYQVLRSREMMRAPRMRRLVSYIVLETLNGNTGALKGYSIGIEVFDRDQSFDPDRDSIVRVQMGRLRTILQNYYLTDGKSDEIVISVPKGSYRAQFSRNQGSEEAPAEAPVETPAPGRPAQWVLALGLIVLLGVAGLIVYRFGPSAMTAATGSKPARMPDRDTPVIAVFAFRNLSPDAGLSYLQKGLAIDLITALSRFKALSVLSQDSTVFTQATEISPRKTGRELGADYILTGSISAKNEQLKITAQLQEASSGKVIWTHDYVSDMDSGTVPPVQSKIAHSVAGKLAQPYGIINRQQRGRMHRHKSVDQDAYRCVLRFYDYAQAENAQNHLETRKCLESAILREPDYAQAWAALSWIYVDEYRQHFNRRRGDTPPLDRALTAARKAVELDPDDSFARRRLAVVYMARDEVELARAEVMKALSLNPNNSEVLADVGWVLKNAGAWDQAYRFARRAISLNPGHPPWYLETTFLYYYRNKNCDRAIATAKTYYRQGSSILLPHVFMAAAAALCPGRLDGRSHVEALETRFPTFLQIPRTELKKLSIPDELIAPIIKHLESAGLHFGTQS